MPEFSFPLRTINLDPRLAEHRARYARQVALDYMRRFSGMVEAAGAVLDFIRAHS